MSNNKIHHVKILPQYFEDILSRIKTFEIRYNDRDYKVGDLLYLREYRCGEYTGRETVKEICYIIDDPRYCKKDYVVLGFNRCAGERLENELAEFSKLYPDVKHAEIPDTVWAEVKIGIPLAAAYALYERKLFITEKGGAEL